MSYSYFFRILPLLIGALLLTATPVTSSSLQLSDKERQWLSEHPVIRVSGPQAFPPFQFFNEDGQYVGIASDYLEYVAMQLGVTIQYAPKTKWSRILELIKNRELDILSCAAITEGRKEFLLFSEPHIKFPLVVISRKDGPSIRNIQDIEGMRLALKEKISTEEWLKKHKIKVEINYISSPAEALRAVSLGQSDVAIENLAAASYLIEKNGYTNLKIATSIDVDDYALAIGIRKDWPIFQSILNKSLAAITEQKHREIRQRWFSVRYEHGITAFDILIWVLGPCLVMSVILGTFTLWNRRLVKEIEERKKVELRLRESERKMTTLIDNLPGMVYRCRNEHNWPMEFISDGCSRVTGYQPNEISNDSPIKYGDIIHPEDQQYVWDHVQQGVGKKENFEIEYRIIAKSGKTKWVWERGTIVSDIQTNNIYLEGFIADITRQKDLAEKLQQSQKIEAIGTLAGGIAHDFNNLLSSVIGYTEFAIEESEQGSTQHGDLQEVLSAGIRAKDLVRQILTFARKSEVTLKPARLDLIIAEALKFLRATIPVDIKIKHSLKSQSLVLGNATQIHQIIMNLCSNAAQAMEDNGGILELNLTEIDNTKGNYQPDLQKEHYLRLTISDTGGGITSQDLEKIFEPYFTTKPTGEGTGLGLAMVHGIVESYGGKIEVSSTLNVGTEFTIYLPTVKDNTVSQETRIKALPGGNEHILFIDDEVSLAKMGERLLTQLGYVVTIATSSIEGFQIFETAPYDYDLIISDITMPEMTGDKLTKKIAEIRPDIPVILCTGFSKKLTEKEALELGSKALIYKPIDKEELALTIRKVFRE